MTRQPTKRLSVAEEEQLMDVRQVAAYFGVNPKTVTRWAAKGRLPSLRTPGGQLRFRPEDVHPVVLAQIEERTA